jgi:RNA polymerase sigma-70 factor (ECF subfamily)
MNDRNQELLDAAWHANHRFVVDVAYRMLGSLSDAEDVAQEAFARLLRVDISVIDDVRAWLAVVTTRLCVDHMKSARVRREHASGAWLPEPIVAAFDANADPADRVTLDDSVRIALLVVLEQLSPAERACFVLHDVFQFSFDAVASIVGRTPAACRQLASRARRHVEANVTPARFSVEPSVHREIVDRFIAACASGDVGTLTALLDPDVDGVADTGGRLPAGFGVTAGRDNVLPRLLAIFGPKSHISLTACSINGEPGALALRNGKPYAAIAISIRDGRIYEFQSVADPAKLANVTI